MLLSALRQALTLCAIFERSNMKQSITTLLTVLLLNSVFGQQIISGNYDSGLKLSFDSATNKVTGFFEDYTGMDNQTKNPRFSCILPYCTEVYGPDITGTP